MKGPVIVPLDGSRLAEQALPFAAAIAQRSGSPLHLLTVHEPTAPLSGAGFDPSYDPRWAATTAPGQKQYLEGVAERLSTGDLEVVVAVPDGPVIQTLLDYVARTRAALLVMTTHGRGGLDRLWLGSTLDRTIREATVPVLVVRSWVDGAELELRRIVIPLDGSVLAETVLGSALSIAGLFRAACELVRVVPVPYTIGSPYKPYSVRIDEGALRDAVSEAERYLEAARARIERADRDVVVTTRVVEAPGQPVAGAILKVALATDAHLIALATHGRGGLRRLVLGSVADKLIRAASLPLLVVRPEVSAADG